MIFPEERKVFLREHGSRMYNSFAYFIATITADIPNLFLYATLGSLIYYFAISLNTSSAERFFIHYGYLFLLCNAATGLGYVIGSLFSDPKIAVSAMPIIILPFVLVGGFFVNQNNAVPILKPFEYISLFKYGFQVLTLNEYTDLDLT